MTLVAKALVANDFVDIQNSLEGFVLHIRNPCFTRKYFQIMENMKATQVFKKKFQLFQILDIF